MTLRNIANNYAQDIKNHGNTRQNGEVMDFSINGMLPSQLTSDQYQALVIQLHPLNGTVTTDVADLTLAAIPKVIQEEISEDEPPF